MTSLEPRNPETDELLSPENSMFLLIDYQPTQVNSINSMNKQDLIRNVTNLTELMKTFDVPIVLSTVNVVTGRNKETIPQLKELLSDVVSYDRTSINSWEDKEGNEAVKKIGRKNIIICGLWTEACLTFPTLDALKEGFEVFVPVDAVGGTSKTAHEMALRRVEQAGAKMTSLAQIACEFQRDWNRTDSVPDFIKIMQKSGFFLKLE
ncbi:Amidase [Lactococcus cremoris subsp. cremoris SK11]|uniref:Amidase n=2 Tax=Lactococcus lactis subsp. cremoris TaxID=1359 RepID=Q02XH7_LACLS|nr:hydrolase [Lactococcus cremoris]ABJ73345.1 Amidase [Lactococcus cremoris subsp. cremoris SK11]ARE23958.1 hydrolase [Lactococcus cremoris]KZK48544.1 Isochorismatase family [Lactococcus cremoris]KZK50663.1 Isochorismatase family [Lactococcus cremoris]MCT4409272.1 hydrolase [Lactococcus cremoris]